jgi:hypothetical protein
MRKDADKFLRTPLQRIFKIDFSLKINVNFLISADPNLAHLNSKMKADNIIPGECGAFSRAVE